jgi:glycosyltransferase involved in cell wall biosynthesis
MARWGVRDLPLLLRLVDDVGADVVHVQYQTGAFGMRLAPNLLLPALRRRRTRPLLAVTFHDLKEPYLFPKAGPVRGWATEAVRRGADLAFVTNGRDLADVGGRARVLPIGSNIARAPLGPDDLAETRAWLGLAAGDFALGYFGFVDEWKGVDTLVAVAEQLWDEGRPVRLVFVGGVRAGGAASAPAYEQAIRARLAGPAADGRALWTGFASPEETSAYLQALDAIALPFTAGACYRHGTLIAAIENGCAIVTTRPDPAELSLAEHGVAPLVDRVTARLVAPGDAEELAAAVADLIEDQALRRRIAAGAAALAPQFAWERIARTSLAAYEEQLALRRGAAPAR